MSGHATMVVENVQLLAAALRPTWWNDEAVVGYLLALVDLDLDVVRSGVLEALRTMDHMPTPAELRRTAVSADLDLLAGLRDGAWLAGKDFPPSQTLDDLIDLVDSGRCHPECLFATSDPLTCTCRCRGGCHGDARAGVR